MAAELSRRLGWLTDDDLTRIEHLFRRANLPVKGPALGAARYLELMARDKKVDAGQIRFVLLKKIGTAVVEGDVKEEDVRAVAELKSQAPSGR